MANPCRSFLLLSATRLFSHSNSSSSFSNSNLSSFRSSCLSSVRSIRSASCRSLSTSSSSSAAAAAAGRVMAAWRQASPLPKQKVFSWKQFFDSGYFWNKANVGPFFLFLFGFPYLYGSLKTIYNTFRYRRLNQQEVISDYFTWLHERFLEDEVESVLLQHVPPGGFDKSCPGLFLGPSMV